MTLGIGPNLWDERSSTNGVGFSAGTVPVPRLRTFVGFLQAGLPRISTQPVQPAYRAKVAAGHRLLSWLTSHSYRIGSFNASAVDLPWDDDGEVGRSLGVLDGRLPGVSDDMGV